MTAGSVSAILTSLATVGPSFCTPARKFKNSCLGAKSCKIRTVSASEITESIPYSISKPSSRSEYRSQKSPNSD